MAPQYRRVIGASIRGAVHIRDNLPNQDAVAWSGPTGPAGTVAVAVADGHGGRKSFRSEIGARLAVDIAVEAAQAMADGLAAADATDGPAALADLAGQIPDRWAAAVHGHLAVLPLGAEELAALARAEGAPARAAVESNPLLAYGATLLLALVVEASVLFMQLGDGDILLAGPSRPAVRPLSGDPRLLGNETTSLCMPGASGEFRTAHVPLDPEDTTVIVLATDGLANAYPDETSFLKVGADLVARIVAAGVDRVAGELEGYLQEASAHSGDDVTMAVVFLGRADVTSRT